MSITQPVEPAWYDPLPEPGDSWRAQNLLDYAAHPEPGPSIGGCVYAGKRHLLSGESESGKSWLALAWCIEELGKGHAVVYIDHEMGRSMTLERLRVLGASDRWIPSFRYVDPSEPAQQAAAQILELVEDVTLVIIDATIGSLSLHALDENSTTDIERWYQRVVDPLRASGAAVVVLDHVTKNPETRGKYAIGSQRKVGASDVHLSCECIRPFGRHSTGMAKVTVKKDRPGHLPRPTLGTFTLDPNAVPNAYTWDAYNELQTHDPEGHFRPTGLMERVSNYLADNPGASKKDIETGVVGKAAYKRQAIEALIREDYIETHNVVKNHGQAIEHTLLKPYTEAKDTYPSSPSSHPSSPETGRGVPRPLVPLVPPYEVGDEVSGTRGVGENLLTLSSLEEKCPACSSLIASSPWSTAGGTYCCHDCARGEACNCKYLKATS